jgi:hypothetical protein
MIRILLYGAPESAGKNMLYFLWISVYHGAGENAVAVATASQKIFNIS